MDNYLATAPILYMNGNVGPRAGLNTAFVAAFDALIYAFDPLNLAAGPLYVLNPLEALARDSISTDHLSLTQQGTLLFSGYDDGDGEYSVWAVPGIAGFDITPTPSMSNSVASTSTLTATPSRTPSHTPTPTKNGGGGGAATGSSANPPLSAGGGAAITIAVLLVVGGGVGYGIMKMGGVAAVSAKIMGGGYSSFGSGLSKPTMGSAFKNVAVSSATSSSYGSASSPSFAASSGRSAYNSI